MPNDTKQDAREFDVVVWGATGFTGQLVAEYLVRNRSRFANLRWALGGRSAAKLTSVRAALTEIDPGAAAIPQIVADASDPASLEKLVASTRVVATTVGPFRQYGEPLVAACARLGTHYCDLTGEPHFVRDMIDAHHAEARTSGARIVHCCGFDSVPSDLGVLMMQESAREAFGQPLEEIRMLTLKLSGGVSGGTIASALLLAEEAVKDSKVRRQLADPYVLDPERESRGPDGPDQRGVRWDAEAKRWTAPFVMAAINTRVVRRSNALLGYPYGHEFRYSEAMGVSRGPSGVLTALGVTAGLGAFFVAAATRPGRALLGKALPAPGEGPRRERRDRGHFTLGFFGIGRDSGGAPVKLRGTVKGTSDPGYGETAKMLAESAACLALDGDELTSAGGILTPASAMGVPLLARLREAGMAFEVEKASESAH